MNNEQLNRRAATCAEHGIPFNARIADAIERARVVEVLDAWARSDRRVIELDANAFTAVCDLVSWGGPRGGRTSKRFLADTLDAARAAAAKAIESGEV